MMAKVNCSGCGRGTHREVDNQDNREEVSLRAMLLSSTTSFKDLMDSAFEDDTAAPAACPRCNAVVSRTLEWKIVTSPEVLLIQIDQITWTRNVSSKAGRQVPAIPEELNLAEYLYDKTGPNTRYRLMGVVNHSGKNLNCGHYVSHVRDASGNWFMLDDDTVSASSVAMLQTYNRRLGVNQMIPHMVAYIKIHEGEGLNALATRAAYPQSAPRAFLHPQIVYNPSMTVDQLKDLCKRNGVIAGTTKSIETLQRLIDEANSPDSTFNKRLKDWLIRTCLSTGKVTVDAKNTQAQLARKLRAFMKTQAALVQAPAQAVSLGAPVARTPEINAHATDGDEQTGDGAEPQAGVVASTAMQAALDAANARITQLEQTNADLQRRLRGTGSRPSSHSGAGGRSPRTVTTDQIRELIQRLPDSPGPVRGTKRPASDAADRSPETQKRQAIQLAAQACAAIDAGAQLAPAPPADNHRHSDAENQRPPQSGSGPGSGPRLGGSPPSATRRRCHRCPTIAGEIHHQHAHVCGWLPGARVSPLTRSEIDEHAQRILNRRDTGEEDDQHPEIPSDVEQQADDFLYRLGLELNEAGQIGYRDITDLVEDGDTTRDFLNDNTGIGDDGDTTRNFLDDTDERPTQSSPRARSSARSVGSGRSARISPTYGHRDNAIVIEDGDETQDFLANDDDSPQFPHSRSGSDPPGWDPRIGAPGRSGARTSPQP